MANIQTRQQFIDYCLRALGKPVIKINVADEQIQDRVDDAIAKFQEFHYDGSVRTYIPIVVDQTAIDTNRLVIPDEYDVMTVSMCIESGYVSLSNDTNFFNNAVLTDLVTQFDSTSSVERWLSYQTDIQTMSRVFGKPNRAVLFNRYYEPNQLVIQTNLSKYQVGTILLFEVYLANNPDTQSAAWNNPWLKHYATALIKAQWGQNLSKFSNLSLPGGVQFDAASIIQSANDELQSLIEQLMSTYRLPPMGFLG
jgi:hypothetical protein